MAYGVEIWEWKEKESLEKVMLDYIKWMFRVKKNSSKHIQR